MKRDPAAPPPPSPASRSTETTTARGTRAERAAESFLVSAGLDLIARNVHVGRVEIDLVLRDGPVIAVVEVRTRGPGAYQRALDSIDPRKQARLRAAGERLWRARFAADPTLERMRFDAVAVELLPDGEARIEHVKAAF